MPRFPDHLSALLTPEAYPHPVASVRLIETHISWVLLTGEFAYKLKRPVHYSFIDLRSAERRAFLCAEELRLNRRFAPELYLDVCTISAMNGRARMAGEGTAVEHAVRMRQFRCEDGLDHLLESNQVEPAELETFGRDLAMIHAGLPVAQDQDDWGKPDIVCAQLSANFAQCLQLSAPLGTETEVQGLSDPLRACLQSAGPWISVRRHGRHVRECHGDLHARNVVRHGGHLVAFDCMEFEPAFRWIDVAEEVAFLLMDMNMRGKRLLGYSFLRGYLAQSGDFELCRLLQVYGIHRALVRAKVAALEGSGASHEAYLTCARRMLEPQHPLLLLTFGQSGSGKTWLANRLAPMLGTLHIRSDVERKRLAGLAAGAHSDSDLDQGLYSQEWNKRLYEHLVSCADHALAGGYSVIVDATFSRREDRARFRLMADERGIDLCMLRCQAPKQVREARVIERQRSQADASEADLAVLARQESQFEPITDGEGLFVIDADTTHADVVTGVRDAILAGLWSDGRERASQSPSNVLGSRCQ
jgi:uncharacterized protein